MAYAGNEKETLAANLSAIDSEAASAIREEAQIFEENAGQEFDESEKKIRAEVLSEVRNLLDSGHDIFIGDLALMDQKKGYNDFKKEMVETFLKISPINGRGVEKNQNVILSNIPGVFKIFDGAMEVTFRKDQAIYDRVKHESKQSPAK